MIRHANAGPAQPIVSLPYPVRLPTTFGSLVAAIGCTLLLSPCEFATRWAAIALASVTLGTEAKHHGTSVTAALSKNDFCHNGALE